MRTTIIMGEYDLNECADYEYWLLPDVADAAVRLKEALLTALYAGKGTELGAGVSVRPIRSFSVDGRDGKIEIRTPAVLRPAGRAYRVVFIACLLAGIGSARIECRGLRTHIYHDRPRPAPAPSLYTVALV